MPIKAIIFDIDGVLADSRAAVVHNTRCLLDEFGLDVPRWRVERMSSAHSAESVLVALVPSLAGDRALLEKMLARLRRLTVENIALVRPTALAAAVPMLSERYAIAAASNRKTSARLVLDRLGIGKCFRCVLTSDDAPYKPDPAMVLLALERLGVRADEAVFVGDNAEDMLAGKGAGVRAIMLDGTDAAACGRLVEELVG